MNVNGDIKSRYPSLENRPRLFSIFSCSFRLRRLPKLYELKVKEKKISYLFFSLVFVHSSSTPFLECGLRLWWMVWGRGLDCSKTKLFSLFHVLFGDTISYTIFYMDVLTLGNNRLLRNEEGFNSAIFDDFYFYFSGIQTSIKAILFSPFNISTPIVAKEDEEGRVVKEKAKMAEKRDAFAGKDLFRKSVRFYSRTFRKWSLLITSLSTKLDSE